MDDRSVDDRSVATENQTSSVLVVDDRRLIGDALALALGREEGVRSLGRVSHLEAASRLSEEKPDVAVVDPELPGTRPAEVVRRYRDASPQTALLILHDRQSQVVLAEAVEAGAAGYVRMADPLAAAVEKVIRAGSGEKLIGADEMRRLLRLVRHRRGRSGSAEERADRLTPRELEILQHMADGLGPEQISFLLGFSPYTLRTHVQNILTKLGVHSKTEALAFAIRHGKVSARR